MSISNDKDLTALQKSHRLLMTSIMSLDQTSIETKQKGIFKAIMNSLETGTALFNDLMKEDNNVKIADMIDNNISFIGEDIKSALKIFREENPNNKDYEKFYNSIVINLSDDYYYYLRKSNGNIIAYRDSAKSPKIPKCLSI